MSNRDTLTNDINRIFSEKLNVMVPSDDTDLVGEGVLDSLMFVDLLVHLEQQFGVKISLENMEIDNFRSIGSIVKVVQHAGNGNSSAFDGATIVPEKANHGSQG